MKDYVLERRGNSIRIRIERDRDLTTGKRAWHLETVKPLSGETRTQHRTRAKARAVELMAKMNRGEHVERSAATVETYFRDWLGQPVGISPKTIERYRQLAEQQIYPHLGTNALQKLTPADVQGWHATLLSSGGKGGKPLSARTVGHAHRLLHAGLARAAKGQIVFRNVASLIGPPKVEDKEVAALRADQIGDVLERLQDHSFYPLVVVALGTGLRRGELLALRWSRVDLDGGTLRVEELVEETKAGLRFKAPKSRHGRRTVSLAAQRGGGPTGAPERPARASACPGPRQAP